MTIFDEVRAISDNYYNGSINIADGFDFSQADTLRTVEYYTHSRYLSGQSDPLNFDKPFYNIVNFRVNVATRATDVDTKDIQIQVDDEKNWILGMIASKEVQNWMKDTNYAKSLNKQGQIWVRYGGVVVKKTVKDNKLTIEPVPWKNLITDPIDIMEGVIIEKHYIAPNKLNAMRGVWENVDEAFELLEAQQEITKDEEGSTTADKLEVWEVHGEFPAELDPRETDPQPDEYKSLRFMLAGVDEEADNIILSVEDAPKKPYKYLAYNEVDGRALGLGVVEDGFEAQAWTNDIVLKQKKIMDIVSTVGFKTNDDKVEDNVLTDLEPGYIIHLDDGKDFNQINQVPTSMPQLGSMLEQWDNQYQKVSSTFESVTGETMPSGTPFRSVAILNQEGSSLFAYRREEFGIFQKEIFEDWVLPHIGKSLNRQHILSSEYSQRELSMIDDAVSKIRATDQVIKKILGGDTVTREEFEQYQEASKEALQATQEQRFIDLPKDTFKNLNMKVNVITTGEQRNKQATLESLSNILALITPTFDPNTGGFAALDDERLSTITGKIIELSGAGLSPTQLGIGTGQTKTRPAPSQPTGQVVADANPQEVTETENVQQG